MVEKDGGVLIHLTFPSVLIWNWLFYYRTVSYKDSVLLIFLRQKNQNKKANSPDLDEMAHNEPSHLDLGCWQQLIN